MAAPRSPILYVWSKKEIIPADGGTSVSHALERGYGAAVRTGDYDSRRVLPGDQQAPLDLVRRIAVHEQGWTDFPVLVMPSGKTLVGPGALSDQAVTELFIRG